MAQPLQSDPDLHLSLMTWECCAAPPGSDEPDADADWLPIAIPGTVASALAAAGRWNIDQPLDADASDWWFRTQFASPAARGPWRLQFDGIATLADVYLNDELLLTSRNMFCGHRALVTERLRSTNRMTIVCRSLSADLARRRPGPRWKTNLVEQQKLRWHRTTLLGRMPGWSPPVTTVGPWRPVRLETGPVLVGDTRLHTVVEEGGILGRVFVQCRLDSMEPIERVYFVAGSREVEADLRPDGAGIEATARVTLFDPPLWWPHTHGAQPLVDCRLRVRIAGKTREVPLGRVGFRTVTTERESGFGLRVNDVPIYCRGACWTVSDFATLAGDDASLRHDLGLARDAGVNMLRIGGTMTYESDRFYELCDELGILVWQDFMFANMDYPVDDPAFAAEIDAEVRETLARLSPHPSVALYCGNNEVQQQAAMRGLPREAWSSRWFDERLPALVGDLHPGVPYLPSSPSGGALPFQVRHGVSHYYGVGAYRRSLRDVRRDDVKFAAECLGFANMPGPEASHAAMDGEPIATHHPRWKRRVPRDAGAAYDFEDVRDHYLREAFGVDPVELRCSDPPRYLYLSRIVSGRMMADVFAEWRSGFSNNRGGLVWFFKDVWPGAGWGLVDSLGLPKPAYHHVRRAWKSRQLTLTDEGLDGLYLHAINETAEPLVGLLEVVMLLDDQVVVGRGEVACTVPARSTQTVAAVEILGGFHDLNHAYRFGPPAHDTVIATLYDAERRPLSEAFHFVQPSVPVPRWDVELSAKARPIGAGRYELTLRSNRFVHSLSLDVAGYLPDDDWFHLPPGREKIVRFTPDRRREAQFAGHVEALNLRTPVKIEVEACP
jgi:beta-mannosidase